MYSVSIFDNTQSLIIKLMNLSFPQDKGLGESLRQSLMQIPVPLKLNIGLVKDRSTKMMALTIIVH